MATKYYCDGCDKELPGEQVHRITVRVEPTGPSVGTGGQYELCKSCLSNMNSMANPRNWIRQAPKGLVVDHNSASGFRVA